VGPSRPRARKSEPKLSIEHASTPPVARGEDSPRQCGSCSLCCTVLRVDELSKLGGVSCVHQDQEGPGCAIHDRRPGICRAYRCLWLKGGLAAEERPDRLRAVLDVAAEGPNIRLEIREAEAGAFENSSGLQAIAERYRLTMPVRITDVADVMDDDRPYRQLMPDGEEHRVCGEWTEIYCAGELVERRRLFWLERWVRRIVLWRGRRRLLHMQGGPRSPLE
jgi:Fe-S-cluster containining protein